MSISEHERQAAAEALEQVLEQIQQEKLTARPEEVAYLRGAVFALKA